jgi:hypothetical protein
LLSGRLLLATQLSSEEMKRPMIIDNTDFSIAGRKESPSWACLPATLVVAQPKIF